MNRQSHLHLERVVVDATEEWSVPVTGWCFVRVAGGCGYWFSRKEVKELNPGSVTVIAPGRPGVVRASRIGPVRLEIFLFRPELMGGLLTLGERESLEMLAERSAPRVWVYESANPVAERFASLPKRSDGGLGLDTRFEAFQVAMSFFAEEEQKAGNPARIVVSAGGRFESLMDQMTEAELGGFSAADLAGWCGCSVRHFSRLFLNRFGVSFRHFRLRLRMSRARQMLQETEMKVGEVARANGYRHLGLFNVCFRREFGMTPTECRMRRRN